MNRFIPVIATLLTLAACGADGSRPAPVPRQRAYPRVDAYPPTYRTVTVGTLPLQVNEAAGTRIDSSRLWLDIIYPAYGATVNCTVTPVTAATLPAVAANRTERMALNAGHSYSELTTLRSTSGASVTLLETPSGGLTPLQFLATDSATFVLSGSVTFSGPTEPADSVRPTLSALRADLLTMLRAL